jgi:hypothetical protein
MPGVFVLTHFIDLVLMRAERKNTIGFKSLAFWSVNVSPHKMLSDSIDEGNGMSTTDAPRLEESAS